jgi:hypothetical protein
MLAGGAVRLTAVRKSCAEQQRSTQQIDRSHALRTIYLDWIGLDWIGLDWIGLDWIDEESACRRGHNFSSLESLLTLFLSCRASQTFQNTTMTNAMTMKLATISCKGIAGGSKSVRVPMSTSNGIPTIKK